MTYSWLKGGQFRVLWVLPVVVVATSVAVEVSPARAQSQPASALEMTISPWTPEAFKALKAWRAGDVTQTRWAADELARNARNETARRDAAVLQAMLLMQSTARNDSRDGLVHLDALLRQDPGLAGRPDCCLARGYAHATLHDSTLALEQFLLALQGYERENALDSQARTWIALADAWAAHNEWMTLIPGAPAPTPHAPEEVRSYRRARIEELLSKADALLTQIGGPNAEPAGRRHVLEAPASIDLALCRALQRDPATAGEGRARLERIVESGGTTRAWARAALELARVRETNQDLPGAEELLDRVAHARLGPDSDEATERLTALHDPRLQLEFPRQCAPDQAVKIEITGRHVTKVELELRRVDLVEHLSANQGRLVEAKLATDGAVAHTETVELKASGQERRAQVSFSVSAGEFVLTCRGVAADQREVRVQRLLIASPWHAAGWLNGDAAVIAALDAAEQPVGDAEVQFWLAGMIVPQRTRLANGTAVFRVPADARLAQAQSWCAVLRGPQGAAFLQGQRSGPEENKPIAAFAADRMEVAPGSELQVVGALLDDGPLPADGRIEVEVRDATDQLRLRRAAELSAARTFKVSIPIVPEMSGVLHLVGRAGGRVVENARSPLTFRIESPTEADFDAVPEMAAYWDNWSHPFLQGTVTARYPWGTPLRSIAAQAQFRVTELPTPDNPHEHALLPFSNMGQVDAAGCFRFTQSLADVKVTGDRPIAVGILGTAVGWDGRERSGYTEAIWGPRPAHAWIDLAPATVTVGQPAGIDLHWFDPLKNVSQLPHRVRIEGPEKCELKLAPGLEGLRSDTWRPNLAGRYRASAEFQMRDSEPLLAVLEFEVAPATTAQPAAPMVTLRAERRGPDSAPSIAVQLDHAPTGPLLILLDDGQPLAALFTAKSDGPIILMPPPGCGRGTLSAWRFEQGRLRLLAEGRLTPQPERHVTLDLKTAGAAPQPGGRVTILVQTTKPAPSGLTAVARLIPAASAGGVPWQPGLGDRNARVPERPRRFANSAGPALEPADHSDVELAELEGAVVPALFEGMTLSADSRPLLNGRARFEISLPENPDIYRVVVSIWGAEGVLGTGDIEVSTANALDLRLDAPRRLASGDRTVAGLMVRNLTAAPQAITVTATGGGAIALDDLYAVTNADPAAPAGSVAMRVPPRTTAWVRARMEAGAPGSGTVRFHVSNSAAQADRSAVVEVEGGVTAPATAPGTTVNMRRTLYVLTPAPTKNRPQTTLTPQEDSSYWERTPAGPDEHIPTGAKLLVSEEFDVGEQPQVVRWEQHLPALARTDAHKSGLVRPGGRLLSQTSDQAAYVAENARGTIRHEYLIVPVRPGACQFRAPEISIGGRNVRVILEAGQARLMVVESSAP